jgi:hypothetical protein
VEFGEIFIKPQAGSHQGYRLVDVSLSVASDGFEMQSFSCLAYDRPDHASRREPQDARK